MKYMIDVYLPGAGPRFIVSWDGQEYTFKEEFADHNIFEGSDFKPGACMREIEEVSGLLGFLTLRKGDTDDEWFDEYSEEHWQGG